jgi:catechol 2,3-dioxygenase-like lactoylglutathione lyase family enzyme
MGVEGIGGIFFRAQDPQGLSAWYKAHLGIGAGCNADATGPVDEWTWLTKAGPVVFAPFPADSDYFAADKAFMINLRVSGIDALIASLRAAGIPVETRAEWDAPETGRFARLHDPEANAIELWQPPI